MSEQRHAGLGIHSQHPEAPVRSVRRRPAMRRAKTGRGRSAGAAGAVATARTVISRNSQARALENSTTQNARDLRHYSAAEAERRRAAA
ncbi:MAG: hypothetical protein WDN04_26795 [Rhodospirillales bacterium]